MRTGHPKILMLLLLSILIQTGCTRIFFYPTKDWVQNPARQGLAYEDIVLIHPEGLRLHGWWLPADAQESTVKNTVKGTVYFLHGNAQNVSTHLMNVAWLPSAGYHVFILDYRGYGLSEGKSRLQGVVKDAQLGLDWLQASGRIDGSLIVFGQSLGASLAIYLAGSNHNEQIDCVIAEAPFTGFRDITDEVMRGSWLLRPLRFLMLSFIPADYEARDFVSSISPTPLLIMHSNEDEIIPSTHGEALYNMALEPKHHVELKGRHISAMGHEQFRHHWLDFSREYCKSD